MCEFERRDEYFFDASAIVVGHTPTTRTLDTHTGGKKKLSPKFFFLVPERADDDGKTYHAREKKKHAHTTERIKKKFFFLRSAAAAFTDVCFFSPYFNFVCLLREILCTCMFGRMCVVLHRHGISTSYQRNKET